MAQDHVSCRSGTGRTDRGGCIGPDGPGRTGRGGRAEVEKPERTDLGGELVDFASAFKLAEALGWRFSNSPDILYFCDSHLGRFFRFRRQA